MSIKLYMVDDHTSVLDGFKMLFDMTEDIQLIGTSTTVEDALKDLDTITPDIMLVDLNLGLSDGRDLIELLKANHPSIKTIGFSMNEYPIYAQEVIQKGGSGYITKNSSFEEIKEAIKTVIAGKTYIDPRLQDKEKETARFDGLTQKELQILRLIAENKTSQEIAYDLKISKRTVDAHRTKIFNKTGVTTALELVTLARKYGIVS